MPSEIEAMISLGKEIKKKVSESQSVSHPFEEDLSFLYGTIFIGKAHDKENTSRNVCIFADGEVDRSPTGSGVSGRMALHLAKNELTLNEPIRIESICDSVFEGKAIKEVHFGPYAAVIPEVRGDAYVTGIHEFIIDHADPLKGGFLLR